MNNLETIQLYDKLKGLVGKRFIVLKSKATGKRLLLGNFIENFKARGFPNKPCIIKEVNLDETNAQYPIEIRFFKWGISSNKCDWCRVSTSNFIEEGNNFFVSYDFTGPDIPNIKKTHQVFGFFTEDTDLSKYKFDDEFRELLKEADKSQPTLYKSDMVTLTSDNIDSIFDRLLLAVVHKRSTITIKTLGDRGRVSIDGLIQMISKPTSDSITIVAETKSITSIVIVPINSVLQFFENRVKIKIANDNIGFDIKIKD